MAFDDLKEALALLLIFTYIWIVWEKAIRELVSEEGLVLEWERAFSSRLVTLVFPLLTLLYSIFIAFRDNVTAKELIHLEVGV